MLEPVAAIKELINMPRTRLYWFNHQFYQNITNSSLNTLISLIVGNPTNAKFCSIKP